MKHNQGIANCLDTRFYAGSSPGEGNREGALGTEMTRALKALNAAPQRKLTSKQRALVDHVLMSGGTVKDASQAVGYSHESVAYNTLKLPHVTQYMLQQTAQYLGASSMIAASRVAKLCTSAKSEYVQLEASKDILDRAGFKPPDRSQIQVSADVTVHIDLGD